jgi:hypothetical protein
MVRMYSRNTMPQGPHGENRPGVELRANLKSISHRYHLFEMAFVWGLTKDTIDLPLGCLALRAVCGAAVKGCDSPQEIDPLGISAFGPMPQTPKTRFQCPHSEARDFDRF